MARAFPGSGTDRILTALTANNDLRSYSIWTYRTSDGGSNLGRLWHKGGGTLLLDVQVNNDAANGTYAYNRRFTTNGIWTVPRPAANEWHHYAVVHDSSLDTNDPLIYLDGVPQTVTETQTPTGTRANNSAGYCIGNRDDTQDRCWGGYLAEFAVWNRLLTAAEILALTNGNSALRNPDALVGYLPLRADSLKDFFNAAPTVTGTTEAPDPPIYKALRVRTNRPAMFLPGTVR